jgi:hypothetical protein
MTKKYVINPENPNGVEMDMTAEEENQRTNDLETSANEKSTTEKMEEKENLKASAKAKLVAGEALTQEEADTIVI